MATMKISTKDVHLIERDDGNISATFEMLSPEEIRATYSEYADITMRRVLKNISGLTLFIDDQLIEENALLDAIFNNHALCDWLRTEYYLFLAKKALMLRLNKQRDAGPISTTNPVAS